jgi:putative methyltransferase (TIGR04325 family)
VGYRRVFPSFAAASRYAGHFQNVGHEHADNIAHHTGEATHLRESDYPVLFHIAPFASKLKRVFDLGGSVGNLFYSLQGELCFPGDLVWEVYDLPMMRAKGRQLSVEKHEQRIRFTDQLSAASGADLFIASGSLHYFERPLAEILASLESLPDRVLINRTPCTRTTRAQDDDIVTVQDNGSYVVPSKIHDAAKLVRSMESLGYTLRAHWPVYERHLWIPMYPDLSSTHYCGFYFVKSNLAKHTSALPLTRRESTALTR